MPWRRHATQAIKGKPVLVKLNSGVAYKGVLACLDGYMNIAMEQTEVRAATPTRCAHLWHLWLERGPAPTPLQGLRAAGRLAGDLPWVVSHSRSEETRSGATGGRTAA